MAEYYHLPFFRRLRSLAREAGILSIIKPMLAMKQTSYEQAFEEALNSAIQPGDTVWDIGANVGLYTTKFLDKVGKQGLVIAYEPFPKAFRVLTEKVNGHPLKDRALIRGVALSDKLGQAFFSGDLDDESVTTTAHLSDTTEGIAVEVITADFDVFTKGVKQPNVVKIDVEGFEEDVLKGGIKTFSNSKCRHLLIEMHFTRMDERKLGDSASRIVSMLKGWGFSVRWVDPSHIHAIKP